MKGIIFRNPSISDCCLCEMYGNGETCDCNNCVIKESFNDCNLNDAEDCNYAEAYKDYECDVSDGPWS